MATIGAISVAVKADTRFAERSITKFAGTLRHVKTVAVPATSATKQLEQTFRVTGSAAASAGAQVVKLAAGLGAVALAYKGLKGAQSAASSIVGAAAKYEQTAVAFEVLAGGAEKATALLEDLSKFAAETPFQEDELQQSARQLLAFGTAANRVVPTLRSLGDVASGVGMDISELAEIYGKARVQGRIFSEDLNQLTGRGIPVIKALARHFIEAESTIRDMAAEGKITFRDLEAAFTSITAKGGLFAGMMERQSETLAGKWSTLKDNVGIALRQIGVAIVEGFQFKVALDSTNGFIAWFRGKLAEFAPMIKDFGTRSIAAVQHFLRNFENYTELAVLKGQLAWKAFSEDVKYFFGTYIPAAIKYGGNAAVTAALNLGNNLKIIGKELIRDPFAPEFTKGQFSNLLEGVPEVMEIPVRPVSLEENILSASIEAWESLLRSDYENTLAEATARGVKKGAADGAPAVADILGESIFTLRAFGKGALAFLPKLRDPKDMKFGGDTSTNEAILKGSAEAFKLERNPVRQPPEVVQLKMLNQSMRELVEWTKKQAAGTAAATTQLVESFF